MKLSKESLDLIAERKSKLKSLIPNAFVEGKLDLTKLKQDIGDDFEISGERYSFVWAGKNNCIRLRDKKSKATLTPYPKESVDFGETGNVFIEGDNLEVLKVLQKAYQEKIKMIYIDPPYNTGKDFVYKDDFSDSLKNYLKYTGQTNGNGEKTSTNAETSGRYHSNWLSMMYPRLSLARNLLTENGVIFVSIDDNEVHNLRLIMNEIFGEENFLAQFVWNTEGHTDNQFEVKINHEYVLAYGKDASLRSLEHVVDPNTRKESNLWKGYAENSITKNGEGNPPSEVCLPIGFPCLAKSLELEPSNVTKAFFSEVETQGYISRPLTKKYQVEYPIRKDKLIVKNNVLAKSCTVFSGWANVNKLNLFIQNNCQPISDDEGDKISFYLSENGVIYYKKEREKASNILSVLKNMGTTEQMSSELEKEGILFKYPKPKDLIKYLIKLGMKSDDLVLDFFAGSGTTGQAVLEQNAGDGGHRRFILVQLPEPTSHDSEAYKDGLKNIADICKARIRSVIKKLTSESKQQKLGGNREVDLGFKVFKLSKSNVFTWSEDEATDPHSLLKHIEESAKVNAEVNPDAVLFEIMLKEGFVLDSEITKVKQVKNEFYQVRDGIFRLFACFDDKLDDESLKKLVLEKDDKIIVLDAALSDTQKVNLARKMRIETI